MSGRRLWVVVLVLVVGGMTVVARAVQVTVVDGEEWRERAKRQHQQVIKVHGPRGTITTADGYVLATSVERVAVQADTHLLDDPELFAQAAAPIIGIDGDELAERLTSGPRTVWLGQAGLRRRPVKPSANSRPPRWFWFPISHGSTRSERSRPRWSDLSAGKSSSWLAGRVSSTTGTTCSPGNHRPIWRSMTPSSARSGSSAWSAVSMGTISSCRCTRGSRPCARPNCNGRSRS